MTALQKFESQLERGRLYRRADLECYSNAVDRHLKQLQNEGVLKKLSGGIYHYPRKTKFGETPPTDHELVRAFLKDERFLLFSQNSYNALRLGTTQLYNETFVYNHKRHGVFKVGGRTFNFVRKSHFPDKVTKEFILIDLINNEKNLKENPSLIKKAKEAIRGLNPHTLSALLKELDWKHAKLVLSKEINEKERGLHLRLKNKGFQFVFPTLSYNEKLQYA